MLNTRLLIVCLAALLSAPLHGQSRQQPRKPTAVDLVQAKPGRDPNQPIDEEYTAGIKKHTTETFFLSPLVDYLPASKTVPTPKAVLGDIAGAEGTKEDLDRYWQRYRGASTPQVEERYLYASSRFPGPQRAQHVSATGMRRRRDGRRFAARRFFL